MGKRNKIRYQSRPKDRPSIVLTGKVYLRHRDEDEIQGAVKGDLLAHPANDALNSHRLGEYDATGFSGYFRLDVFDGRTWQPVTLVEVFPGREHYFSKSECPIDTFALCESLLKQLAGRNLTRSYREHYELAD